MSEQRYRVRFGPVYVSVVASEPGRPRASWQVPQGEILPPGVDPTHLQHLVSVGMVEAVEQEQEVIPA